MPDPPAPPSDSSRTPLAALVPPVLGSLSLGLAPFVPEPHIVGKLRWLAGGAEGMQPADWFDFAMHGAPWVWLIAVAVKIVLQRVQGASGR